MKIIGDGSNRVAFVHVEDAADAVANAMDRGKGVYVIAGEPLTQREIYSVAAKALGVQEPRKHVGKAAADALASFRELMYHMGGRKPSFSREHVAVLANDRVFNCARARKDLRFSPRPLDHGIREMVLHYKDRYAKK
jgi:dihydroflavonol-4-reductase